MENFPNQIKLFEYLSEVYKLLETSSPSERWNHINEVAFHKRMHEKLQPLHGNKFSSTNSRFRLQCCTTQSSNVCSFLLASHTAQTGSAVRKGQDGSLRQKLSLPERSLGIRWVRPFGAFILLLSPDSKTEDRERERGIERESEREREWERERDRVFCHSAQICKRHKKMDPTPRRTTPRWPYHCQESQISEMFFFNSWQEEHRVS